MAGMTRKFVCKRCKSEFNLDVAMLSRVHRCPKCGAPRMELEFEQAPINIGGIDSAVSARHAAAAAAADASPFAPSTSRGLKVSPFPDPPPKIGAAAPAAPAASPKFPDAPVKELPSADISRKWLLAIPLLVLVGAGAILAVVLLSGTSAEDAVRESVVKGEVAQVRAMALRLRNKKGAEILKEFGMPDLYSMSVADRNAYFDRVADGSTSVLGPLDLIDLETSLRDSLAESGKSTEEATKLASSLATMMRLQTLILYVRFSRGLEIHSQKKYDDFGAETIATLNQIADVLEKYAAELNGGVSLESRTDGDDTVVTATTALSAGLRKSAQDLLDRHFADGAASDALNLRKGMADIHANPLEGQLHHLLRQAAAESRQFECRMRKDAQGNWRMTDNREWDFDKKALGEWKNVGKGFAAAASMLSAFGGGADSQKAQVEKLRERYLALLAEKP